MQLLTILEKLEQIDIGKLYLIYLYSLSTDR